MKGRNYKSQEELVLDWMRGGSTLTAPQAWRMWGVTRLASIIFNIKKKHAVTASRIPNMRGRGAGYCVYKLL